MRKRWFFVYLPILAVLIVLLATKKWSYEVVEADDSLPPLAPLTTTQALEESSTLYGRTVRPLLLGQCVRCHGSQKQRGGLRVDTVAAMLKGGDGGPAVVPGKSGQSLLLTRIKSGEMPEGGPPLTAEETEHLRRWIDEGAVGPKDEQPFEYRNTHWAFQPVRMHPVPVAKTPNSSGNPIDAFLAQGREKAELPCSPPAAKSILLRRVTLDLTGLPPTEEDYQAFLRNPSTEAYEEVVDRLLTSQQYGERWARHWMDVWRYSSHDFRPGTNFLVESNLQIWRWRDWLIKSISEDKAYHHMILEMLAADELGSDPNLLAATGYLVRNYNGLDRNVWLTNTVDHMGKAFLGLSLGCARCHDHKFDPLSQKEYYQLRAFFESHNVRTTGEVAHAFNMESLPTQMFVAGNPKNPMSDKIEPIVPAFLGKIPESDTADYRRRRLALAKWLAGDDNPLVARVAVNQIWMRHFGRGLVETPAEFGMRGKPPTHPELLDWLAAQFRSHDWSMRWLHRLIVTSRAYQMSSTTLGMDPCLTADRDNRLYWRFPGRRAEAEVVRDAILHLAGNLDAAVGGPDVDHDTADTSRRRSLYFRTSKLDRAPFLEIFDGPRVEECYRRTEAIVPQQALAIMNSESIWKSAESIAGRLARGERPFIPAAFQLVLGRLPTPAEEGECQSFLTDQQGLLRAAGAQDVAVKAQAYLVHALLNHNDFITIR